MTWFFRLFRRKPATAIEALSHLQRALEYERLRASIAEYRLGHQQTCLELARAQLELEELRAFVALQKEVK